MSPADRPSYLRTRELCRTITPLMTNRVGYSESDAEALPRLVFSPDIGDAPEPPRAHRQMDRVGGEIFPCEAFSRKDQAQGRRSRNSRHEGRSQSHDHAARRGWVFRDTPVLVTGFPLSRGHDHQDQSRAEVWDTETSPPGAELGSSGFPQVPRFFVGQRKPGNDVHLPASVQTKVVAAYDLGSSRIEEVVAAPPQAIPPLSAAPSGGGSVMPSPTPETMTTSSQPSFTTPEVLARPTPETTTTSEVGRTRDGSLLSPVSATANHSTIDDKPAEINRDHLRHAGAGPSYNVISCLTYQFCV